MKISPAVHDGETKIRYKDTRKNETANVTIGFGNKPARRHVKTQAERVMRYRCGNQWGEKHKLLTNQPIYEFAKSSPELHHDVTNTCYKAVPEG